MELEIIVLVGLPASGKSTWAKEFVANNTDYIRVNRDDLRAMLHDGEYSFDNELIVLGVRDAIILSSLESKLNVIIDDTNLKTKTIDHIVGLVGERGRVVLKTFKTPIHECIRRDSLRGHPVGEDVIRRMFHAKIKEQQEYQSSIIREVFGK